MENTYPIYYENKDFMVYSNQSFDLSKSDFKNENLDFYLKIGECTYWGSVFTMKSISDIMKRGGENENPAYNYYFWSSNFIIIKEFSLECFLIAINNIIQENIYEDILHLVE